MNKGNGCKRECVNYWVISSFEVCRRTGLKINSCKSKVMVLNGEEGLEHEVHVDGIRLEYVS